MKVAFFIYLICKNETSVMFFLIKLFFKFFNQSLHHWQHGLRVGAA
jgi:hypothetical protein